MKISAVQCTAVKWILVFSAIVLCAIVCMQLCALRSLQSLHNVASVQCSVCKCALLSVPCGSVQVCITCGSVQVCIKVFSGQFYCYRESLCHSRDPPPTAPPALLLKILYGETHWKIFCLDIVKYLNGVHINIRNMKSLSCPALLPFVSYCVQRNTVDLYTSCL